MNRIIVTLTGTLPLDDYSRFMEKVLETTREDIDRNLKQVPVSAKIIVNEDTIVTSDMIMKRVTTMSGHFEDAYVENLSKIVRNTMIDIKNEIDSMFDVNGGAQVAYASKFRKYELGLEYNVDNLDAALSKSDAQNIKDLSKKIEERTRRSIKRSFEKFNEEYSVKTSRLARETLYNKGIVDNEIIESLPNNKLLMRLENDLSILDRQYFNFERNLVIGEPEVNADVKQD